MIDGRWRSAIDPAYWAREYLGFTLDPWQEQVLQSPGKRKVFNCARQSGKSTVAAIKALHRAIFYEGSLIILLSPSQRQSAELFRKVTELIDLLPRGSFPDLTEDNRLSLTMSNGSRIVSLPSNERTIRGYSAVDLAIEDEAAAVPDDIHKAVRPMLAVSNGEYCQLSTPRGKSGHFWEAWNNPEWEKVTFTAADNPRITPEFLAGEKRDLGSRMYAQEYECVFVEDQEGGLIKREWFKLVDDYPVLARRVRFWDQAATEEGNGNDPDYTAGVLMCEKDGQFWIIDCRRGRYSPKGNKDLIGQTAALDEVRTYVRMEEEGGSSGKNTTDDYARTVLMGYAFKGIRSTGSKYERARPFAAAVEAGNVFIVRGEWDYKGFIDRLCAFPNEKVKDDEVDAAAGAFNELAQTIRTGDEPSVEQTSARSNVPSYGPRSWR